MNQLLRKSLRCVCRSSHLNLRVAVLYANGAGIAVASDVHIHVPATILSSFLHGLFGYFLSHLLPTCSTSFPPHHRAVIAAAIDKHYCSASLTLTAKPRVEKGFAMKWTSSSIMPRWAMTSAV